MKDRPIDKFLSSKIKICDCEIKAIDFLFALVVIIIAIIARVTLEPILSPDYVGFLAEWMDEIRRVGWIKSWGQKISNYAPSYMYLMSFVSLLTKDTLLGLKWLSYSFDFAAAFIGFFIVLNETKSVKRALIGMTMFLFAPAVLIDSGVYCQCDIIYSTFILLGLYFLCKDRSRACMICMGVSLAFKLQMVFILPFLVIMWLKKRTVKLVDFLWIPAVYVVSIIPAAISGRNFFDLLGFYFWQADYYPWGTLNYPNIYIFFDETMDMMHYTDIVSSVGMFVCLIALGVMAYYLYLKNVDLDSELIFSIATVSVFVMVYLLPHMHERYGFLIDLLTIIVACINPKKIWIPCVAAIISILALMKYIYGYAVVDFKILAAVNTVFGMYLIYDLYRQCQRKAIKVEQ